MAASTNTTNETQQILQQQQSGGLPDEVWRHVAIYLLPKDLLSFFSVSHAMNRLSKGEKGAVLWKNMLKRDGYSNIVKMIDQAGYGTSTYKEAYLVQAHKQELPQVEWHPINDIRIRISAREGHLSCIWNDYEGDGSNRRVIITGGFTDDDTVYVMKPGMPFLDPRQHDWRWYQRTPISRTTFTYGASLTALPTVKIEEDDEGNRFRVWKAVQFGGFQAGGYSVETNQVAVLTLKELMDDNEPSVTWTTIPTKNSSNVPGRAYHSATLLLDRYLVVFGGMKSSRSIQDLSILDTETWTWIPAAGMIENQDLNEIPSARHGHSAILDDKRNRIVVFGGGSGSDLLRSGKDNSEVWELRFGDNWKTNFEEAVQKWKWRKIHETAKENKENDDEEEEGEAEGTRNNNDQMDEEEATNESIVRAGLTTLDALCLGRCHHGFKLSPDKAMFLFGSGRPSTNGLVTYDLKIDEFIKPGPVIFGIIPKPRFTGVAVYLEEEGYVLAQGGFCSQHSEAHQQFDVLDLAPGRRCEQFNKMERDRRRRSFPAVTDNDLQNGRRDPNHIFQTMLDTLMETEQDQRQDVARQFLGQLDPNVMGGRGELILQMIANGVAVMQNDDEDGDSDDQEMVDYDDDDDEDYVDG
jgi:hypothetical protein